MEQAGALGRLRHFEKLPSENAAFPKLYHFMAGIARGLEKIPLFQEGFPGGQRGREIVCV